MTRFELEPGPGSRDRFVSLPLGAGALYDFGFAALFLLAPRWTSTTFGVPLPGHDFYQWLIAVFLIMLGAVYLVAARSPQRHRPLLAIAAVGRLAGAVALGLAASRPGLGGLLPLAIADLAFGLIHGAGWLQTRRREGV